MENKIPSITFPSGSQNYSLPSHRKSSPLSQTLNSGKLADDQWCKMFAAYAKKTLNQFAEEQNRSDEFEIDFFESLPLSKSKSKNKKHLWQRRIHIPKIKLQYICKNASQHLSKCSQWTVEDIPIPTKIKISSLGDGDARLVKFTLFPSIQTGCQYCADKGLNCWTFPVPTYSSAHSVLWKKLYFGEVLQIPRPKYPNRRHSKKSHSHKGRLCEYCRLDIKHTKN